MNEALLAISGPNGQRNWTQEWLNAYPYTSPSPEGGLVNSEDDQGIAARLYSLCLLVLRQICRQEQYKSSSGNATSTLKEELGKLYLWGQAFEDGKLDRALEYSDEVRSNVLESLGDIGRLLLREVWPSSISILESPSSQKPIQELKYLVEQTRATTSSKFGRAVGNAGVEDGGSDTDQDDISEDDDTGEICEELGLHTRWLTQLGPTLEQNLIHAENARFQTSCPTGVPFSVSGPAAIYVSLVREKYRQAQSQLVERLGEANWQRHIRVRNRMEASIDVYEEELTIAKSVFRPYSAFHDSGIGTSVPAQTQYAPSHTSFQSSNTEGERESLRVPATPAEVHDGKPFLCFLCKSMLSSIKTRVDWKMHIFSDLQPYICTFTDCGEKLAQFPSRAAWAEHEFSKHRTTRLWTCPECPQDFPEVSSWENHLQEEHRLFFSGPNLQIVKNMALKTEARRIENDECPLCRVIVGKPRRGFVKHVGRHMEEIALRALPRDVEEDTEEGSLSTDHTSVGKSSRSFHFKPPIEKDKEEIPIDPGVAPMITPSAQSPSDSESDTNAYGGSRRAAAKKNHRRSVQPTRDIEQGFTEEDLAGDTFPGTSKVRKAAATKNAFTDEADHERNQLQAHEDAKAYMDNLEGSGGVADSDSKKRRGRAAPPGRCHSCNRAETPEWRRGPDGARTLCNACGLHYAKLVREMSQKASMETQEQPSRWSHSSNMNLSVGCSNSRPPTPGPRFANPRSSTDPWSAGSPTHPQLLPSYNDAAFDTILDVTGNDRLDLHGDSGEPSLPTEEVVKTNAVPLKASGSPVSDVVLIPTLARDRKSEPTGVQEHETYYSCMPYGAVEASEDGLRCAFCGLWDPDHNHLASHHALQCISGTMGSTEKSTKSEMVEHLALHGLLGSAASDLAGKWQRTRNKQAFSHVKQLHICMYCNKEFKRPYDLTKHEKTHSRPWKCSEPTCEYSSIGWPTEKKRDRHINDKHSAAPFMYKCQYRPCPYESKREINCKQHMEKVHGWTYIRSKNKSRKGPSQDQRPPRGEKFELQSSLSGTTHSYFENAKAMNIERPLPGADAGNFQQQGNEDLSSRPACQPCRKSKKGCDRQLPCQRCKDAGLGADQCISEDEGNGRKDGFGRHIVAAAKQYAQDYTQTGKTTPLAVEEGKNQEPSHGNTHPSLSRDRHPQYGNSIFSEDQSVYRTAPPADWLFEPDTAKGV